MSNPVIAYNYTYEPTINQQRLRDTLHAYSEWLDIDQGLITEGDERTHDDLVSEFLKDD